MSRPSVLSLILILAPVLSFAAENPSTQGKQTLDKALHYLRSQQKPTGAWTGNPREPVAISALVLRCFLENPRPEDAELIKKGFDQLLAHQKPDGSIHTGMLANYNTAVIVSALARSKDPAHKAAMEKAVAYLKSVQWSDTITGPDGKPVTVGHPWHGGWGYAATGNQARPDLSNTAMVLEALRDAGVPKDDPAFQRALTFVSKLQNNSETNQLPWASSDGGFIYGVAADGKGDSAAGEYTDASGKPLVRSYGTMTYAGLKSMIYAGLTRDDPRVKAAWNWITENWTLDENPGMRLNDPKSARAGVFYYYQTLAKALELADQPTIGARDKAHDWRSELIHKLSTLQNPDGSFVGEQKFMENHPILVTAFSALALQHALDDLVENPPPAQKK